MLKDFIKIVLLVLAAVSITGLMYSFGPYVMPLTHLCSQPDNFDKILLAKSKVRKIFDGKIFIRTLPTNLFQIFFEMIIDSKVIVKRTRIPDNHFWRNV